MSVLVAKNSLRPSCHHHLSTVEIDKLYDNVIHSARKSALCAYIAKERNKGLRIEYGAQEIDKNLLQEKCSRLKAWVAEMENTMKETLESINKLQADLDEGNAAKASLKNRAQIIEDQVADLQQ